MTAKELVHLWSDNQTTLVVRATISAQDLPVLRIEDGARALFLEFDEADSVSTEVLPRRTLSPRTGKPGG